MTHRATTRKNELGRTHGEQIEKLL